MTKSGAEGMARKRLLSGRKRSLKFLDVSGDEQTHNADCLALKPLYQVGSGYSKHPGSEQACKARDSSKAVREARVAQGTLWKNHFPSGSQQRGSRQSHHFLPVGLTRGLPSRSMLPGAPGQCPVAGPLEEKVQRPRWDHFGDRDFRWAGLRHDFG